MTEAEMIKEISRQQQVLADYTEQILEYRRREMAREANLGRPMGYAVMLPKEHRALYGFDYTLVAEKAEADEHAEDLREQHELEVTPTVLPLFPARL